MQFTAAFKRVHQTVGSSVSIEQLASIANPIALGLTDKRDFYEPVRFALKLGQDGSALRIAVPVMHNPGWHGELLRRTRQTLGLPASAKVELRTVTDQPIDSVAAPRLTSIGHLNVYHNGERVLLRELPAVPIEFSATKHATLNAWIKDKAFRDLPDRMAKELNAMREPHEINEALGKGGVIDRLIQGHMASLSPLGWKEFARQHHVDAPPTISEEQAARVLETASKHVLRTLRNYVRAAGAQIGQQLAARRAADALERAKQRGATPVDAEMFEPVLSAAPTGGGGHGGANVSGQFFQKLATDALSTQSMRQAVVAAIYRASHPPDVGPTGRLTPCGAGGGTHQVGAPISSSVGRAPAPPPSGAGGSANHPWYNHVHNVLLPLRGSYPSDYMARHTKQNLTAAAPYVGDAAQTYQRFHLYSGLLPAPAGLVVRCGKPQPIECHYPRHKRHNKKKWRRYNENMEAEMVDSALPAAGRKNGKLVPISEILAGVDLPLVECHGNCGGKDCAKCTSIRGEMRSRLVHQGEIEAAICAEMRSRLIHEDLEEEQQAMAMDEPVLPPLDDIFK